MMRRAVASARLKWRRTQLSVLVGSSFLLIVITALYWVPLVWWLLRYLIAEPSSLPDDLPFWQLIGRTLLISSVAALVSLVAAYPLVLIWRLTGTVIKQLVVFLMVVPMVMGLLARNYSWIGMMSSSDILPSMGWSIMGGRQLIYTQFSVYLVMSCIFVPIAFFILIQGISGVTKDHIHAARTLGVPDWKIVLFVIVPLTLRAAALAFGLILAMSVGYFITPRMIGGGKTDFVSNAILKYVNLGHFGLASMLALSFLAVMSIPIAVITVYAVRRRLLVSGR